MTTKENDFYSLFLFWLNVKSEWGHFEGQQAILRSKAGAGGGVGVGVAGRGKSRRGIQ